MRRQSNLDRLPQFEVEISPAAAAASTSPGSRSVRAGQSADVELSELLAQSMKGPLVPQGSPRFRARATPEIVKTKDRFGDIPAEPRDESTSIDGPVLPPGGLQRTNSTVQHMQRKERWSSLQHRGVYGAHVVKIKDVHTGEWKEQTELRDGQRERFDDTRGTLNVSVDGRIELPPQHISPLLWSGGGSSTGGDPSPMPHNGGQQPDGDSVPLFHVPANNRAVQANTVRLQQERNAARYRSLRENGELDVMLTTSNLWSPRGNDDVALWNVLSSSERRGASGSARGRSTSARNAGRTNEPQLKAISTNLADGEGGEGAANRSASTARGTSEIRKLVGTFGTATRMQEPRVNWHGGQLGPTNHPGKSLKPTAPRSSKSRIFSGNRGGHSERPNASTTAREFNTPVTQMVPGSDSARLPIPRFGSLSSDGSSPVVSAPTSRVPSAELRRRQSVAKTSTSTPDDDEPATAKPLSTAEESVAHIEAFTERAKLEDDDSSDDDGPSSFVPPVLRKPGQRRDSTGTGGLGTSGPSGSQSQGYRPSWDFSNNGKERGGKRRDRQATATVVEGENVQMGRATGGGQPLRRLASFVGFGTKASRNRGEMTQQAISTITALFVDSSLEQIMRNYRAFVDRHTPVPITNEDDYELHRLREKGFFFYVDHLAGMTARQFTFFLKESQRSGVEVSSDIAQRVFQALATVTSTKDRLEGAEGNSEGPTRRRASMSRVQQEAIQKKAGQVVGSEKRLAFSTVVGYLISSRLPSSTLRSIEFFLDCCDPHNTGVIPATAFHPKFVSKFIDRYVTEAAAKQWRMLLLALDTLRDDSQFRWSVDRFLASPKALTEYHRKHQLSIREEERKMAQHRPNKAVYVQPPAHRGSSGFLQTMTPQTDASRSASTIGERSNSSVGDDGDSVGLNSSMPRNTSIALTASGAGMFQIVPAAERAAELELEAEQKAAKPAGVHGITRAEAKCVILSTPALAELFRVNDFSFYSERVGGAVSRAWTHNVNQAVRHEYQREQRLKIAPGGKPEN